MTSNEHHYQQFFKSVQRKYPNISKQLYKSIYKENLKFALEGCPVHSHHFVGVSKLVEVLCLCELALYSAKHHDSIVSQNTVRRRKRKRKIVVSHGGDGDKDGKVGMVGMVERMDAISFSDDADVVPHIEGRVQSCKEDNKGEEQAMTLRGGSIGNGYDGIRGSKKNVEIIVLDSDESGSSDDEDRNGKVSSKLVASSSLPGKSAAYSSCETSRKRKSAYSDDEVRNGKVSSKLVASSSLPGKLAAYSSSETLSKREEEDIEEAIAISLRDSEPQVNQEYSGAPPAKVIHIHLPPGPLDFCLTESNGMCVAGTMGAAASTTATSAQRSDVQYGDIILSMNDIDLGGLDGGVSAWNTVLASAANRKRTLLVTRLPNVNHRPTFPFCQVVSSPSQSLPRTKRSEDKDLGHAISELAKRVNEAKSIQLANGRDGRNAGGHKAGDHCGKTKNGDWSILGHTEESLSADGMNKDGDIFTAREAMHLGGKTNLVLTPVLVIPDSTASQGYRTKSLWASGQGAVFNMGTSSKTILNFYGSGRGLLGLAWFEGQLAGVGLYHSVHPAADAGGELRIMLATDLHSPSLQHHEGLVKRWVSGSLCKAVPDGFLPPETVVSVNSIHDDLSKIKPFLPPGVIKCRDDECNRMGSHLDSGGMIAFQSMLTGGGEIDIIRPYLTCATHATSTSRALCDCQRGFRLGSLTKCTSCGPSRCQGCNGVDANGNEKRVFRCENRSAEEVANNIGVLLDDGVDGNMNPNTGIYKCRSCSGRMCKHPGCTKQPQGAGGLCTAHGGKGKKCKHPGCTKQSVGAGGLCTAHGGKWKKCKHPGCTKQSVGAGGLCRAHGGKRKKKQECKYPGCTKSPQGAGGLCTTHGGKRKKCKYPDCTKQPQGAGGLCRAHGGKQKK